uniref:Tubulin-specific chaperone E n=1 Tax=Xiphophorus couchianus TaxID=32473 RepID=A0A3B5LRQ7_9TELE
MPLDPVGRRISCGKERATVRYVGHVSPYEGLWLGVEWDNPERGKHDGSHEGVRYFTCRNPKGGSFVRPQKVSFGVDFLTAVYLTYQTNAEEVLNEEIFISSKKLEWFVVEEKRYDSCICRIFTNVNRISLTSDPWAHRQAFSNLKLLALNNCDFTWLQMLECAPMWPQLEDLSLENNNIRELQRPEGVLQTLKSLNLSCNPLMQESVSRLSSLPRYTTSTDIFPALMNLNLDHNNISEWSMVNELAKLPCLVKLSCRDNKLVSSDGNPKTVNQMIIAKLGHLLYLNNSEVCVRVFHHC